VKFQRRLDLRDLIYVVLFEKQLNCVDLAMGFLGNTVEALKRLPDPLIYTLIAAGAAGAIYASVHHANHWRPRKGKRVKLGGADGKKIEDCTWTEYKIS
jgi:hypothetical protein